ncbi:MAG TPA: hypothetical protein VHB77_12195, partial [Planctomycetaceae bacterium]|nr:hypothetical protein [Planctomycetaceae bacterium]
MKHRLAWLVLLCLLPIAVWWVYRREPARPLETAAVKSQTGPRLRAIRVALTAEPVSKIVVSVEGPYHIKSVADRKRLGSGKRLSSTTIQPEGAGIVLLGRPLAGSQFDIVPEQDGTVWVGDHAYRGVVRLQRTSSGRLLVI